MKHVLRTVIIIMLTFGIVPFTMHFEAEAAGRDDFVRIGLLYGNNAVTSCTIESEEGFILGTADDRSFEEGLPLPAYDTLVIENQNGNIMVMDEDGTLLSSDLGSSGCIMPADYENDGILYFENTPYRDGITFLANSNGSLSVINYITLEHYVYGVLNSELNYTNPEEALKAQAVAARSYGELNLGKHSADGFDLCTTTHCQVYKGYSGEYPATNDAVDATKGEIIYCHGEPVMAFYFKNSGGYTQNVEDVWANSLPYLKAVKDDYSPSYPWSTSLSLQIIQTKLEAAGFRPGSIEAISINKRNETGAVSELKIKGSDATIFLRKENIRNVLGATIIKSNLFELTGSTAGSGSGNWFISNGFSAVNPVSKTYVIGSRGTVQKLDQEKAYSTNGSSTVKLGAAAATETVTADTVNFSGYGYGHGVGMPQDSAVQMAKAGFTYDEILEYYYTDIEIN